MKVTTVQSLIDALSTQDRGALVIATDQDPSVLADLKAMAIESVLSTSGCPNGGPRVPIVIIKLQRSDAGKGAPPTPKEPMPFARA